MMKTGIEVLLENGPQQLEDRRVGLVSHAAAVLRDFTRSVDALLAAGVNVTTLFAMEHGYLGVGADKMPVTHSFDEITGLPIYSLYGDGSELTPDILHDMDVLVYDAQDLGVRFQTFLETLCRILSAASAQRLPVIVLGRPNPLNGVAVEGPSAESVPDVCPGVKSLPVRHGLTPCELARWFDKSQGLNLDLQVVPMEGWERGMTYDRTGLPWVPVSPVVPRFSTAIVYPGASLLEGTNVSAGRGTGLPFEQIGAPWIDHWELARTLNALDLPGVYFRPTAFEPARRFDVRWGGYSSSLCFGVQIHLTDPQAIRPVRMGVHLVATIARLFPDSFGWDAHIFDRLVGTPSVRERIIAGDRVEDIVAEWEPGEMSFAERRRDVLVYH